MIKCVEVTVWSCMLLFSAIACCQNAMAAGNAEENITATTAANATNSQKIIIDPATGEILPAEQVKSSGFVPVEQQTARDINPAKLIHHADGSMTAVFNGQFRMPLNGHVDENGKVIVTHKEIIGEEQ